DPRRAADQVVGRRVLGSDLQCAVPAQRRDSLQGQGGLRRSAERGACVMRRLSSQRAAASIALLIGLHASAALAFSGGIDSTFFGLTGCPLCHFGGTAPTVVLSGPTTVAPGETVDYTLTIFGNSAQNYGGFNVAAPLGTLSVGGPFSAGTTNLVGAGGLDEITHFMPKQGDFLNTI